MRYLSLFLGILLLTSCGSGDTGESYKADTTSLNPESGNNASIPAGDRGEPDSSIGATTNAKAPESNANIVR